MVKNAASLITKEKSFIKITYKHPRNINGLADVSKVVPKVKAMGRVRASIDTSAGGGGIPSADRESYGVIVGVKDN
jgi:hypothetical protein